MQVMTWGELIVIILIAWIAWYGFVALKYFPKGFTRRKVAGDVPVRWNREKMPDNNNPPVSSNADNNTHAKVHEVMQEIKSVFTAAVRDQLNKEQIFDALKARLDKSSTLPVNIQQSINLHVINEFSMQLKISVTETEINSLW